MSGERPRKCCFWLVVVVVCSLRRKKLCEQKFEVAIMPRILLENFDVLILNIKVRKNNLMHVLLYNM